MEISVGFADKDSSYYLQQGYQVEKSEIGNVYLPIDKIEITGDIAIRYEKHPWIETFEVDGIMPKPEKRKGYGNKDVRGFVKSLSTIYQKSYEEFDAADNEIEYFENVANNFVSRYSAGQYEKMFIKFCGFTENMWREGNKEMHDIAMYRIIPILKQSDGAWQVFYDCITDEFKAYIKEM